MPAFFRALAFAILAFAALEDGSACTSSARAATLGDARIGFAAERVLVIDGKTYVGKMWQMPGKQRHEQDLKAFQPVFILHADSPIGDVVLPQLHTVVQFTFPPELAILGQPDLRGKSLGEETVNGVATTKYAVDKTAPQGHATGTLWISPDGIPMKLDGHFTATNGKVSTVTWELRHVKIGPQPASLFEIPAGFSKLPADAVAPLLGMRLKPLPH